MNNDDSLATRHSLIDRLRHWSDQSSWQEFYHRYSGLIYSVARKAGLSDDEAQEVVQETVISVAKNVEGFVYDPKVCSFKNWMLRLTRWRVINRLKKRARDNKAIQNPPGRDVETFWNSIPDAKSKDWNALWEAEWQRAVYSAAVEAVKQKVSPAQFQLFDLYVNENWPPEKVARRMNKSKTSVYIAKHRISRLLRKEIQRLEENGM